MLVGIWAAVLGVPVVGIHDNFFELGGHSLLATQVISRVREVWGGGVALRALFDAPTVAEFAAVVEASQQQAGTDAAGPAIARAARGEGALPLSFAQQRLWFLDQLEPNSPFYNIPVAVRLQGQLNLPVLEQTLNEIVRRHEVLRTTFALEEGLPVQRIQPELFLPLQVIDLSELPADERNPVALRLAIEEAEQPFDLARGPLLRVSLLRLAEEEHVALITMHHIVSDGWSMSVFVHEVAALYEAFASGAESPLQELPIQYADFAAWQHEWLQGEVLDEQLGYWRKQLGGELPTLELPTDKPHPAVQTYKGASQCVHLPVALSAAVKELSRRESVTPFMTLLAAFQTLLHRYTGQEDICVGTPVAGRNRAEVEGLIGFFVNTLVMRADLAGAPSFRALLRRVRDVALNAYAHQDMPFEKLVEELQPERSLSHMPLFQVMFHMLNAPQPELHLPGITLSFEQLYGETAKFDLLLTVVERDARFLCTFEYNTDLFETATITRMLGHLETLLTAISANADERITRLPLMPETERTQALVEWNNTATTYERDLCVQQIFEHQTERTPDALAIINGDERLSYAELNERANQLAHYLHTLGIEAESLVGVYVEQSVDMLVALLAILKAGGAYLPLDPTQPPSALLTCSPIVACPCCSRTNSWSHPCHHTKRAPSCSMQTENRYSNSAQTILRATRRRNIWHT